MLTSGMLTTGKKTTAFAMEWLPEDYYPKEPEHQNDENVN